MSAANQADKKLPSAGQQHHTHPKRRFISRRIVQAFAADAGGSETFPGTVLFTAKRWRVRLREAPKAASIASGAIQRPLDVFVRSFLSHAYASRLSGQLKRIKNLIRSDLGGEFAFL